MHNNLLRSLILCLTLPVAACGAESAADSTNMNNWSEAQIADYGITFKHPPTARLGETGSWLPGIETVDGRRKLALHIQMRPEYSDHLIEGVRYNFATRLIMITDAAELDKFIAKRHGWTERPTTDLYPFDYETQKDALLTAVERLYLASPTKWQEIKPVVVGGKKGASMSCWKTQPGGSRYFHEIVAVPVAKDRILLLQAGYFKQPSDSELQRERQIFTSIVQSVRFH